MPLDEIVEGEAHADGVSLVVGRVYGRHNAAVRAKNETAVLDGEEARVASHAVHRRVSSVEDGLPCLFAAP
jgi:hypothetical protein